MVRCLLGRSISLLLLALVAVGGGRLPTVDALVFHEGVANSEAFRSHFEASSACHDDGCSVRSTAHESRLSASLGTPALKSAAPDDELLPSEIPAPPRAPATSSQLSRAPPLPV
jgi:hypothetical protein